MRALSQATPDDAQAAVQALAASVRAALPAAAAGWFDEALDGAGSDAGPRGFPAAYAGTGRRLGPDRAIASRDLVAALEAADLGAAACWSLARQGRCVLLYAALGARPDGEHARFVDDGFRTGDSDERVALLGALPVLPRPERFASTAVDACRTNVVGVFEAIACENSYPQRCFADASFNQMVMKAVSLGVAVERIVGLGERANADLERMAADYASERRAAGREVPDDIALITTTGSDGSGVRTDQG